MRKIIVQSTPTNNDCHTQMREMPVISCYFFRHRMQHKRKAAKKMIHMNEHTFFVTRQEEKTGFDQSSSYVSCQQERHFT